MELYTKILGGFLWAAAGDAMGAATESLPVDEIVRRNGGFVDQFLAPQPDLPTTAFQAGQVTDAFSMTEALAQEIIRNGGRLDAQVTRSVLLQWHQDERCRSVTESSIATAIAQLRGQEDKGEGIKALPFLSKNLKVDNFSATNGAAISCALPAGLLSAGNCERAVDIVCSCVIPPHDNSAALAAACAVAAAVSRAMQQDATVDAVAQAALTGAEAGHQRGAAGGKLVAVPNVARRIRLAAEFVRGKTLEQAVRRLADTIGAGPLAHQSVPTVFGILIAAAGDPERCIWAGTNIGYDSSSIASMAGAIAGVLRGAKDFPPEREELLRRANGFDLSALSRQFADLIGGA